jgi:hypothetical protein
MCHLQSCSLVPALDVEPLIGFAAVQNALVTANLLSDEVQSLDQLEAELLSLLVFSNGNVFDVTDEAKVVDAVGEDSQPRLKNPRCTQKRLKKRTISALQATRRSLRSCPGLQ